jgi:hypothetical protein
MILKSKLYIYIYIYIYNLPKTNYNLHYLGNITNDFQGGHLRTDPYV